MTRIAISIRAAAYSLLDRGYTIEETNSILNSMKQPTEGYVYADEMPVNQLES